MADHHDETNLANENFETRAIHAGQPSDPRTGAVVPPIFQVSTFHQDAVGSPREGWEYSRSGNPTRAALEACLADLDGGTRGLAFASGLAAEDCILRTLCAPHDHVVVPGDAYGGTFRLVDKVFGRWGVTHKSVDLSDLDSLVAAMTPETTVVWCETPSNPLLGIADIAAVARIAHEGGAKLVVDNTFASPYLQQPLALGADIVVYSTTKYLGGHSDVVGGAVMRGVKTLAVRMDRHCENAARIAAFLQHHKAVSQVFYPGLPSHAGHEIAAKQMRNFGGMVSFRMDAGEAAAVEVCNRARLFTLAESLGGVESLIEHPGRMTHASVVGSPLEVPADLVRLSVGIENIDDLLADLEQALG
jgi:cystathionine gamma-synthase